ncbi:polysaccharide deacetylase, partial [Xenorhabdus sp. 42]|nr:polysaccharide deacetylase [Xenorhabdus sp. 42]
MKYKWLYIGLIFSIMMALVPVSALAYTNTPHNWGI